ncbi:MAG: Eco57I restriction-modification methylase domain-containing protein [Selenomonadaceae bacterium]|nr:Eco57I restriction-modification methylase domain-containing protein [Selenomonadaceae bacterium]
MIDFNAPPLVDVMKILLRGLDIKDLSAVKPRALKNAAEKNFRTRSLAEVCSPSHLVKFMVDALDNNEKIFWQVRVEARCLEPACGEAPFITNRYDAESGEEIPFDKRAGILDKKFRAIPKDADKIFWAYRAVQSVYGFELQDDSLLLARANVLLSFAEFVGDFSLDELKDAANIIAWNFFKFDGMSEPDSFFAPTIIDWRDGENFSFGGINMAKFTFVICNPPYQDDTSGDNKTFAPPVYNHFMKSSQKVGEKVVLITPARFLFDAGATPKDFNRQMLNDPHFKVLDYAPDAKIYFKGVEIKGGVAVTVYDSTENFGAIGTFTPYPELNAIHKKICVEDKNFRSLREIIFSRKIFKLTEKFYEENPNAPTYLKDKNSYTIGTNAFTEMPEYFSVDKPDDENDYVQVLGLAKMRRTYRWIRCDYVNAPAPLEKFKVFVPASSSSGAFGEILSTPLVESPHVCCSETFITVGAFDTRAEAEACLKYIKSKFARAMLGILKVTQHNTRETWAKVPLEDFSSGSDIDWRASVDAQLYRKYNLTAEEISFIETHVKEMS